jgi:hypothetical protein
MSRTRRIIAVLAITGAAAGAAGATAAAVTAAATPVAAAQSGSSNPDTLYRG